MAVFELVVVLVALVIASFTDLKVREVPDWLNFSLIALGAGVSLIKAATYSSVMPIYYCAFGFGLAFLISALMFYTGQWGGGDAKMMMGIGSLLGASFSINDFFVSFIFNLIIAGAAYGLLWGVYLGVKNRKPLYKEFRGMLGEKNIAKARIGVIISLCLFVVIVMFLPYKELKIPLLIFAGIMLLTFYLWIYVKAIEKVCMIKKVSPRELTEGDWIVEDIFSGKKLIASKKDLGVSKEQIELLRQLESKGKVRSVTIKTGIPFIPSFLLAFLITYFFGNLIYNLVI